LPSTNTYVRLYSSLQLYTGCPIPWQQKPLQLRLGQKSAGIHRPREHLGRQRNWPCLVGGGSVVGRASVMCERVSALHFWRIFSRLAFFWTRSLALDWMIGVPWDGFSV